MLAGSVWQKQPRYDNEEGKSTAHFAEDDREITTQVQNCPSVIIDSTK